jgi:aldose 1-epimerase
MDIIMLQIKPFGSSTAKLYTLENSKGMKLVLTDMGAAIVRLFVPDRAGAFRDVVLGYEDYEAYASNRSAHGATVGRCANRIGGACFTLNGVTYHLDKNEGENILHGGFDSYYKRLWRADAREAAGSVAFSLHSPDGDQGMPGAAEIAVTYSLGEDNSVSIRYHAAADKDTVFNLTNHSYFNLDGHGAGPIGRQYLWLDCDTFTPIDREFIPTGEIRSVKGAALDFTTAKPWGRDADGDDEQIAAGGGYDHNFIINRPEPDPEKPFAKAWSEQSGIEMQVFTDLPGVQAYGGNMMGNDTGGKDGVKYQRRGGFCLETQYYPDAPNKPGFPSDIFPAGKPFSSATVYKFSIRN